jgi:hypothetical protein
MIIVIVFIIIIIIIIIGCYFRYIHGRKPHGLTFFI